MPKVDTYTLTTASGDVLEFPVYSSVQDAYKDGVLEQHTIIQSSSFSSPLTNPASVQVQEILNGELEKIHLASIYQNSFFLSGTELTDYPIIVYGVQDVTIGEDIVALHANNHTITTNGWEGKVIGISGNGNLHAIDIAGGSWNDLYPYGFVNKKKALIASKKKPIKSININYNELNRLVTTDDSKRSIVSVIKQHQHSKKIFDDWGLGETIEYGRAMTMLFWGNPGTGKTWAAQCIAKALGKKLQIVDSALLQTSEPGGMERNIKEVFLKSKNGIVMFDECDSLLASRDRVGMILGGEINCLLTEIEKFEGICILTTNRVGELDKALERRISLILEFPDPAEDQRRAIWKNMIPKKMPLAKDVKIKDLAQYELSGGLIKNVVLNAARMAVCDDKEQVEMIHFEEAIVTMVEGQKAFAKKSVAPTTHGKIRSMG